MTQSVIAAEDVTKAFTPEVGVFDLSFEIPEGRIIGFIGPSGSGKTTTVRLMTGLLRPSHGALEVLGMAPSRFDATTRARIGYMPQHAVLYPDLTLAQNLKFAASLYGLGTSAASRHSELTDFLDLGDAMHRLPQQASGGEKRRLMLAAALVHSPNLLFLDEPTAGIDPVLRKRIWERLETISESGTSLVVTTQYVGEAAYCDYVAVLAEGRLVAFETPEDLRRLAYGGELIDVTLDAAPTRDVIGRLESAVGGRHLETVDGRTVRLVVQNAGEAGPAISEWSRTENHELRESRAHGPPFDDVFVELMDTLEESEQPEPNSTVAG